jgi:hypothetical protein
MFSFFQLVAAIIVGIFISMGLGFAALCSLCFVMAEDCWPAKRPNGYELGIDAPEDKPKAQSRLAV